MSKLNVYLVDSVTRFVEILPGPQQGPLCSVIVQGVVLRWTSLVTLRTVPPFVTAHNFSASRDIQVS